VSLALYDTATQAVSEFVPLEPGKVGIYVCGATVQSAPHIGHLRPAVAFDILRRWLTHLGYEVTLIRNVTDIDDKILAKAAEAGVPWWAHANAIEREFTAAYDALAVIPPTYEPRATGHVPEMIELMQQLIDRGHAYATGPGNVWFDVLSWPQYGELTRQKLADLAPEESGSSEKHSPYDFALWKAPRLGEPETAAWDTPWGRGRPGWHLECSAMAGRYLGDAFDIHGGGLDLRFPHHENEQAQSRAAGRPFANRWMHSAWITASGEKMSKSLGNGMLAAELLASANPAVVRYAIAQAHYRSMLEWSETTLTETAAAWERITNFVTRATELLAGDSATPLRSAQNDELTPPDSARNGIATPTPRHSAQGALATQSQNPESAVPLVEFVEYRDHGAAEGAAELPEAFVAAMNDDLNVPAALGIVHEHVRAGNTAIAAGQHDEAAKALAAVRGMLDVLGLDPLDPHWQSHGGGTENSAETQALDALVQAQLAARAEARAAKDWARADQIRDQLKAAGIVIEDSPTGPRWTLANPT